MSHEEITMDLADSARHPQSRQHNEDFESRKSNEDLPEVLLGVGSGFAAGEAEGGLGYPLEHVSTTAKAIWERCASRLGVETVSKDFSWLTEDESRSWAVLHYESYCWEKCSAKILGAYNFGWRTDSPNDSTLDNKHGDALTALHRTLLYQDRHVLSSQHPLASPELRRLIKYSVPAEMWRHAIHACRELLNEGSALTGNLFRTLLYLANSMMALLYETNPGIVDTWIECLRDLARHWVRRKDEDNTSGTLGGMMQSLYSTGINKALRTGHPYEYLAILFRPNAIDPLQNHSKPSLDPAPFSGRSESVLTPSDPTLNDALNQTRESAVNSHYRGRFSSAGKEYTASGVVAGTTVAGVIDTGAERSCVSSEFVKLHDLSLQEGTRHRVKLGSGKMVKSPGLVSVPWQFAGETQSYALECSVLPGCVNDLILGSKFLRVTETLTTFFTKRVQTTVRALRSLSSLPGRLRLSLLGGEKQRVWGVLDDAVALALPDTGSDVMLISERYARSRGFKVDRAQDHRLELELGDGSHAFTSGIVKGLDWSFGASKEPITCDFYVLQDLPGDIVFSNEFLFELDAFSRYEEFFIQSDSTLVLTELYNIRLISQYSAGLLALEDQYLDDLHSPGAFSRMMIEAELVRRNRIRDEINCLPEDLRAEALRGETERRRLFDEARARHLARGANPIQLAPADTAVVSTGPRLSTARSKLDSIWRRLLRQ